MAHLEANHRAKLSCDSKEAKWQLIMAEARLKEAGLLVS